MSRRLREAETVAALFEDTDFIHRIPSAQDGTWNRTFVEKCVNDFCPKSHRQGETENSFSVASVKAVLLISYNRSNISLSH